MPMQDNENQILPFFYSDNLPENTAYEYREFAYDKYKVYAVGSLFSEHIKDVQKHISVGLDFLVNNFDKEDGEILDRMKASIFHSGDKLADFLVSLKEPVDDVDYSLAIVAFAEGIVYVWLDGGLNVRIYRGKESLIVNEEHIPQFFGSATVELGDIFAIGFDNDLKKHDPKIEDYVLEKGKPKNPVLLLDYQIDLATVSAPEEVVAQQSDYLAHTNEHMSEVTSDVQNESMMQNEILASQNSVLSREGSSLSSIQDQDMDEDLLAAKAAQEFESESVGAPKSRIGGISAGTAISGMASRVDLEGLRSKAGELSANAKSQFSRLQKSGAFNKVIEYIKLAGTYLWRGLLAITGAILDFFAGLLYKNSPHQYKRFQGSLKKRNLQYLLILILVFISAYFLLFRPGGSTTTANGTNTNQNGTSLTQSENQTREKISQKKAELTTAFTNAEVAKFNTSFADLKTLISNAQKSNFSDNTFLTLTLSSAQTQEDSLYKVTPISKVDEAFLVDTTQASASVVDFSNIGTDVYAIDRVNSAILKSNSTTQKLELFASDKELSAMTHIACDGTSCYITDENQGIVILDIQNKTFSKFSALKTAGQNVAQIETFKVGTTVYIYTFLPSQGKVVRYSRSGQGLTTPTTWNKSAGFGSDVQDFGIDGGIYEINTSGTLRRFFSGSVDAAFSGLTPAIIPFGTDLQIASTVEATPGRFYIADSTNERIVVYSKDLGQTKQFGFLGSYKYRGTDSVSFTGIKQLVVSDDEKSLYVLSNNTVFRISASAI